MSDWDAALYREFERERTRPAADLLAQVGLSDPRIVVDLGCGPGNSTALLAHKFPGASVTGIDTSADMLASARARLPACRFAEADIATWTPETTPDLMFANAALQWVPDHARLIPRLLALLAPGGVLAIQMPDNRDEPSHAMMRQAAAEAPFVTFVGATVASRVKTLGLTAYYDLLAPLASADIWRTAYQHPMASAHAIVTWLRSTGLRPFLAALPTEHQPAFLARYEALIDGAYPARADGRRLLTFPRLFIVARRPSRPGTAATGGGAAGMVGDIAVPTTSSG